MKTKKFISAIMATAMVASTMTAFSAFAVDDPDVTGNSLNTAEPISFNEIIDGTFSKTESFGSCDHDWYSFSLDTASKLNLRLYSTLIYSTGTTEPTLEIIDADNDDNVVFKFDRFQSNNSRLIYLTAGNYYIHLASNNRSSTGDYSLQLINTPTEESFDSKSNNNIGNASAVDFGTEYTGQISVNDDADYYTFDLEEEGMVTFTFKGDIENVD